MLRRRRLPAGLVCLTSLRSVTKSKREQPLVLIAERAQSALDVCYISAVTVSHGGAMAVVEVTNFHSSYSPGGVPGDKARQPLLLWHLSPASLLPG